jgi:hypothetical protein
MGSQIFLKTLFAAEKEPIPLKRKGIGLIFGDVTFTDRVLDHLFAPFFPVDRPFPGRKQGSFRQEVDGQDESQNDNQAVHAG